MTHEPCLAAILLLFLQSYAVGLLTLLLHEPDYAVVLFAPDTLYTIHIMVLACYVCYDTRTIFG